VTELNLASLWEGLSDAMGSSPAIVQGTVSRTWAQFDDRAARLAAALQARGVGVGDKIAVDMYNSPEFLEIVFASLKLGAVPVPINYRYREDELAYLIENSHSVAVFFHEVLADRVLAAAKRSDRPMRLIVVPDDIEPGVRPGPGPRADMSQYEDLIASAQPAPRTARDADAEFIVYTGGTTGHPKGAVWRHRDLIGTLSTLSWGRVGLDTPQDVASAVAVATDLARRGQRATVLAVPPLMHSTALFESVAALLLGGTVVLCRSRAVDGDEILTLVERYRIRQLSIVGDAFASPLLAAADRAAEAGRPYDLSSLRRVTSSGLVWSVRHKSGLARHWRAEMHDVLASTEGGPYADAVTLPGEHPAQARFRLLPNARIVDENWHDVVPGSGTTGRIVGSGTMPTGYLHDPQRSAVTWPTIDGVRYSVPGDLATLEADGSVTLLGRGSEVVNTGGEKVFVEEVEEVIVRHASVVDVLVVGVPDDRLGSRIAAIVQVREGAAITAQELRSFVGQSLADHKRPRQVVFVDQIQRSAAGKANRTWARQLAEGEVKLRG
jgi:3-oxocholest-4-en-26-oate---CoA ligase